MYTPHGGGRGRRSDADGSGSDLGVFEYYATGVAGLVATALLVVVFYPTVVAAAAPLRMLSSTAIVFALVLVWLLLWSGVELVWAWRTHRE